MIVLKREENIERYQLELVIKTKTKQSPFISILILCKEKGNITPEILQECLLPDLPKKACENLLNRLCLNGFLWANYIDLVKLPDGIEMPPIADYRLTHFGLECSEEQIYWTEEKGLFDIYITKSRLIEQTLIYLKKSEKDEKLNISRTPIEIQSFKGKVYRIGNAEILIEQIYGNCIELESIDLTLEIQSNINETKLLIRENNDVRFEINLETNEDSIKKEILIKNKEITYDYIRNVLLVDFNKEDLTFIRNTKIEIPLFRGYEFKPVILENITYLPFDLEQAELWFYELLFRKIKTYYFDDDSFTEFAKEIGSPILNYYQIDIPDRKNFTRYLGNKQDSFYQMSKLTTIDYLNY